jgi:hypothetical protein
MYSTEGKRKVLRWGAAAVLAAVPGVLSLTAVAPAAASPAGAGRPVTLIPAAAMLQPGDLDGVETSPAADDLRPWLRPAQPFGPYRSAAEQGADRAVQALYPVGDVRPTVLLEYVAVYRGAGAAQYLREIQRAVGRCCGRTDADGRTWRIVDRGIAGRHSMLLSVAEVAGYEGSTRVKTTYVAVARTGHAIVVLADIGWEAGAGHEALVRRLAPAAVARAAIMR